MNPSSTPEDCLPASSHAMGAETAAALADSLKAIADPIRIRMLSAIAADPRGECCVCDLTGLAEVSQPTISHHLKVLRETGLVVSERRGTWVYYRIAPSRRAATEALLEVFAPAFVREDLRPHEGGEGTLHTTDARLSRLAEELGEEFEAVHTDLVLAIVRESHVGLIRAAKHTTHTLSRTGHFARQRLSDLTRNRATGVPQVLFVCVHNAGRSQLAAAILNRLAGGTVIARSAGSAPAPEVLPTVRSLLQQMEPPQHADEAFPKPLTDDAVRAADVVVTMGCGDVCPIVPGTRYEDWTVPDPALASPEGVQAIRDDLEFRARKLLDTFTAADQRNSS